MGDRPQSVCPRPHLHIPIMARSWSRRARPSSWLLPPFVAALLGGQRKHLGCDACPCGLDRPSGASLMISTCALIGAAISISDCRSVRAASKPSHWRAEERNLVCGGHGSACPNHSWRARLRYPSPACKKHRCEVEEGREIRSLPFHRRLWAPLAAESGSIDQGPGVARPVARVLAALRVAPERIQSHTAH